MIAWRSTAEMPAWLSSAGPEGDVIISTRVRLARNLSNYVFPKSASLQERNKIFREVTASFRGAKRLSGFNIINFHRLPRLEQLFLVEERMASPDLLAVEGDRGVICDGKHRVSIMVNEEDHLRLQCLDAGFMPSAMYAAVDEIDTALGKRMGFAFDARRGFLTSCPTNSGTGLRVSFLMHLPGLVLTKTAEQVLHGASQMGVSTRGFFGEHSEVLGAFFQLSNQATLGAPEQDFLSSVQTVVQRIIGLEREARARLMAEAQPELKDKIHRAHGILLHAQLLEVNEFINLASALRLGIELGIFDAITQPQLKRLMLTVLPAHMQVLAGKTMDEAGLRAERARMVRAALRGAA